jgi:hypothetical protein
MEIHRLHEMLTEAGIEHTFNDRTPTGYNGKINWGYQVCVYYPDGERMISAIEGYGSYGFGGWDHGTLGSDEKDGDLIEIMGLLTPEESEHDSVVGYLTAEEVFRRIKEAVE